LEVGAGVQRGMLRETLPDAAGSGFDEGRIEGFALDFGDGLFQKRI